MARTAAMFQAAGRPDLAEEALRFLVERFPGTPAAQDAATRLATLRGVRARGSGRTEFIVWSTTYGAFLGLAVPAALGADFDGEEEAFGAGLLLGAPTAFFVSKAYANAHPLSSGRARLAGFAAQWGTWQGLGWRAALNLGEGEYCDAFGCYPTGASDAAPWQAAIVGGLGGLGASLLATSRHDISARSAELARHGALWGTWYATAALVFANVEGDDQVLTWLLLGGDLGLAAGLIAGPSWNVTPGQVRLVSIAGVAGLVAGFGLDLLLFANADDPSEDAMIGIPTAAATLGLILAGTAMKPAMPDEPPDGGAIDTAVFQWDRGARIGMPLPEPTAIPVLRRDGRIGAEPGLRLRLLDIRF